MAVCCDMVLAPLSRFPFCSWSEMAWLICFQSNPLCVSNRLSSLAITARAISGEIFPQLTQVLRVWKFLSSMCWMLLWIINGVTATGIHLSATTHRIVNARKAAGIFTSRSLQSLPANVLFFLLSRAIRRFCSLSAKIHTVGVIINVSAWPTGRLWYK